MEETPPAAPTNVPPKPTGAKPAQPSQAGLVADLKGVLMRDKAAMVRVAKSPKYFVYGLVFILLVQLANVASQWMAMKEANEFAEAFGIDVSYGPMEMIGSGLTGLIMAVVLVYILFWLSLKWGGTKQGDIKGFFGLYGFLMLPMALSLVPIAGLIALIWVLVLYFTMMKAVFGFNFWKALGVSLVAGILAGIVMIPVGLLFAALGLGTAAGFSYSFGDVSTSLLNL